MPPINPDLDRRLRAISDNEESSRLAERYFVMPGHGVYELFECHRYFEGPLGQRFRRVVADTAGVTGMDPGLLAANAIAEHRNSRNQSAALSVYLTQRHVIAAEVGLDHWETLRHRVRRSGISGVEGINARRYFDQMFENERHRSMPHWAFWDGRNALLASATLLKLYDNTISAKAERPLAKVTRFALIRYAFNASPLRAYQLAGQAASGEDILPTEGPAGPQHPLRTATIRAVQAIALSEDFF